MQSLSTDTGLTLEYMLIAAAALLIVLLIILLFMKSFHSLSSEILPCSL